MSSGFSYDSWITRREERCFKEHFSYCGIVECIQSRSTATVIIGQKNNGKPLMWHEDWDLRTGNFGRVLLLVSRLRSSINGETYNKETPINEVLHEGEFVMVELKFASQSPDNIYQYFANSAYKNTGSFMDVSNLSSVRDPLRGIVNSMVMDAAVVCFGTYVGGVAKCVLTIHNLYYKGERVKKNLPLGAVISVGSQIFLEVSKWNPFEVKQEWEKLLYKEGVIFRATLGWLKGDPRPSKGGSNDKKENPKGTQLKDSGSKTGRIEKIGRNEKTGRNERTGQSLSNLHAYYGIVEAITSSLSAVVCTAHRNGEPLTWEDNWLARGACLERAFLMVDHIRPSKNEPEYMKGTHIRKILNVGDPLKIVVESCERRVDKCYKWFVKTSWKVGKEESECCMIVESALPGHLSGVVDSLISHSIGIISFKTYHGMAAKAFFTHSSFYQNGEKIMDHLPLGSEVTRGTEVFLIVDRWNPGKNPGPQDQDLVEKQVCYRATMVWNKGSTKPREGGFGNARKGRDDSVNIHQKHDFPKNPHFEKFRKREEPGDTRNSERGKNFHKRGGRQNFRGRGRGRGGYHRRTNPDGSRKDDGDNASNCTEDSDTNLSDISSMSDYFGAMHFGDEGSSRSYLFDEGKFSGSNQYDGVNQQFTNPLDKGINGTIISMDEDWGLVQVNENEVHDFQPNSVLLYGLKLDSIPLNRLFRQGQVVKVYMKGDKVSIVEYGAPQLPNQMRQAVLTYCERSSVPRDVREMLEKTMLRYGV